MEARPANGPRVGVKSGSDPVQKTGERRARVYLSAAATRHFAGQGSATPGRRRGPAPQGELSWTRHPSERPQALPEVALEA